MAFCRASAKAVSQKNADSLNDPLWKILNLNIVTYSYVFVLWASSGYIYLCLRTIHFCNRWTAVAPFGIIEGN